MFKKWINFYRFRLIFKLNFDLNRLRDISDDDFDDDIENRSNNIPETQFTPSDSSESEPHGKILSKSYSVKFIPETIAEESADTDNESIVIDKDFRSSISFFYEKGQLDDEKIEVDDDKVEKPNDKVYYRAFFPFFNN